MPIAVVASGHASFAVRGEGTVDAVGGGGLAVPLRSGDEAGLAEGAKGGSEALVAKGRAG